jgi:serine/threonine-protein kinase
MPPVSAAAASQVTGSGYSVVHSIASGGMGRVELVARRDGRFFRLFAQKRLRPELVDDLEVRRMFLDEARIAGLVRHPNVVSVVDVGEDAAGPFLVMDFVEGVPLSKLVTCASARGEQLPLEVCFRIAGQVAEALHALHELRDAGGEFLHLVHRDVSPQNILVGFDGIARVTDFGIARALGRASKTATGILKGKLGYMSPEQLRFEEIDRRADLFAFGVVLFEMLTGERLYQSVHDTDGPRRILNEPPPDLADYRDDVEPEHVELLFELLAKDRAHRPPDARSVARRIEAMLASLLASRACVDTGAFLERLLGDEHEALRQQIASIDDALRSATPIAADVDARRASAMKRRPTRLIAIGTAALAMAVIAATVAARARMNGSTAQAGSDRPNPAATIPVAPGPRPPTPAPAPVVMVAKARSAAPVLDERVRSATKRKLARRSQPTPSPADCSPPYTLDEQGGKQFKVHCLVDVRR